MTKTTSFHQKVAHTTWQHPASHQLEALALVASKPFACRSAAAFSALCWDRLAHVGAIITTVLREILQKHSEVSSLCAALRMRMNSIISSDTVMLQKTYL